MPFTILNFEVWKIIFNFEKRKCQSSVKVGYFLDVLCIEKKNKKQKMNTSYVIRKSRNVHPLELGMSNSGLNFVKSSSAGIFATLPRGANTADLEYRHVFMFLYS